MFPLINIDPDLRTRHNLMKVIEEHSERYPSLEKEECMEWFFSIALEVYSQSSAAPVKK